MADNSYLNSAVRFRPPSTGNKTEVALVAATASAAQTITPVGTPLQANTWVTICCDVPFNVTFGTSSVANPTSAAFFPASVPQSFEIEPGLLGGDTIPTSFKVTSPSAGNMMWWKSSYT